MVQEKVTRGETVAVDEDKMVRAGNPHRVVKDGILAPSPVFVPKMNDGEPVAEARLGDDIGDGRAGPVIGDDKLKVRERLPRGRCKNKPEVLRLVIHGSNEAQCGWVDHI